jgi:hypothetical protein
MIRMSSLARVSLVVSAGSIACCVQLLQHYSPDNGLRNTDFYLRVTNVNNNSFRAVIRPVMSHHDQSLLYEYLMRVNTYFEFGQEDQLTKPPIVSHG